MLDWYRVDEGALPLPVQLLGAWRQVVALGGEFHDLERRRPVGGDEPGPGGLDLRSELRAGDERDVVAPTHHLRSRQPQRDHMTGDRGRNEQQTGHGSFLVGRCGWSARCSRSSGEDVLRLGIRQVWQPASQPSRASACVLGDQDSAW